MRAICVRARVSSTAEPDRMDKPGEFPIMILADLVMQVHIRKPSLLGSNSDIGIMNHDSINLICRLEVGWVDGCKMIEIFQEELNFV